MFVVRNLHRPFWSAANFVTRVVGNCYRGLASGGLCCFKEALDPRSGVARSCSRSSYTEQL